MDAWQAAARQKQRAQDRQARAARRHQSAVRVAAAKPPAHRKAAAKAAVKTAKAEAHARHLAAARQANQQANRQAAVHNAQARQSAAARNAQVRQAARVRNAASAAAARRENQVRREALRALHQSKVLAAYRARTANAQAAHNARLAAQRAHWIALHGDGSGGKSIRFWQTAAANVPVKVISVDLNDPNVKVSAVMARRGNGTAEPFRQMIERANPNVAVTGTFFSLDDLQPVGDIVIDGSLVHFGGMGRPFASPRRTGQRW